jgi:hypothetical protein
MGMVAIERFFGKSPAGMASNAAAASRFHGEQSWINSGGRAEASDCGQVPSFALRPMNRHNQAAVRDRNKKAPALRSFTRASLCAASANVQKKALIPRATVPKPHTTLGTWRKSIARQSDF